MLSLPDKMTWEAFDNTTSLWCKSRWDEKIEIREYKKKKRKKIRKKIRKKARKIVRKEVKRGGTRVLRTNGGNSGMLFAYLNQKYTDVGVRYPEIELYKRREE